MFGSVNLWRRVIFLFSSLNVRKPINEEESSYAVCGLRCMIATRILTCLLAGLDCAAERARGEGVIVNVYCLIKVVYPAVQYKVNARR